MGPKPNDGPRHFHGMTDHNCGQLGEFLKRFWGSWDSEAQKCVDCEAEFFKKNWTSAACRWFLFPLSTCMSGRLALWDLAFRDASALPSLCDPLLSSQVGHEEFPSPKKWWSVHCQSREHPHIFTPFYTSMCLQTFGAQVWFSYIQWNKENQWIGVSPVFSITARTAHPDASSADLRLYRKPFRTRSKTAAPSRKCLAARLPWQGCRDRTIHQCQWISQRSLENTKSGWYNVFERARISSRHTPVYSFWEHVYETESMPIYIYMALH